MTSQSPSTDPRLAVQPRNSCNGLLSKGCFSCSGRAKLPWRLLDDEDIAFIEKAKVCKPYLAGQSIFEQGSACRGLFCIISGMVAVRQTESNGASVIIRIAGEKALLGYRTLFAEDTYPDSAEVLVRTLVCFIPSHTIHDILNRNRNLARHFLQRLAIDQAAAQEKFLRTSSHPVYDRLIHLVLTFSEHYGSEQQDGSLEIRLPVARKDMAAMIGTSTESVIRAMRSLEKKSLAFFDGRTVSIPRPELLSDGPAGNS